MQKYAADVCCHIWQRWRDWLAYLDTEAALTGVNQSDRPVPGFHSVSHQRQRDVNQRSVAGAGPCSVCVTQDESISWIGRGGGGGEG